MSTSTQTQLIAQILKNLGVLPTGQTPEVEDVARVRENVPKLAAQLAADEVVYLPDIENVPDEWFLSVAAVMAYHLRSEFPQAPEEEAKLTAAFVDGKDTLVRMRRLRPTGEPVRACYL